MSPINKCTKHVPFVSRKTTKDCLGCYRERAKKYTTAYSKRMRDYLDAIRLERGCAFCGYKDNAAALQFDHIIPLPKGRRSSGRKSYSTMNHAKALVVDTNIQVLCANCHCIKTRNNKDYVQRVR